MVATNNYRNVFDIPRIGVLHDRAMQGTSQTPDAARDLIRYLTLLPLKIARC